MKDGELGEILRDVAIAFGGLVRAAGEVVRKLQPYTLKKGAALMYVVKDTQAAVAVAASFDVQDAEGQVVTDPAVLSGLQVEIVSDNPGAVAIAPDPGGDPKKGVASFGSPGLANVNVSVKLADGTLVGSFGAQFTVTAGDPAAIAGGTIAFEGLTES